MSNLKYEISPAGLDRSTVLGWYQTLAIVGIIAKLEGIS